MKEQKYKKLDKTILKKFKFKTDDNELIDLLDEIAQEVAESFEKDYIIKNDGTNKLNPTTTTQFRQFYDKVLELHTKSQGLNETEFNTKVLPFVRMLKSKVAYSLSRRHAGENFKAVMDTALSNIDSIEELQNFKYFLEAIMGYMKK